MTYKDTDGLRNGGIQHGVEQNPISPLHTDLCVINHRIYYSKSYQIAVILRELFKATSRVHVSFGEIARVFHQFGG